MASKRLTNALKDEIRNNIRKSIADKHSMVQVVYDNFALAVYHEFHGQYEEVLTKMPEGTIYQTTKLSIYLYKTPKTEYCNWINVDLPKTLPCFVYHSTPIISVKTHPTIVSLYDRYQNLKSEMVNEQKLAISMFNSIANGCNTLHQLQDVWPEVSAYLPDDLDGVKPNSLPMDANAVETLNGLLIR